MHTPPGERLKTQGNLARNTESATLETVGKSETARRRGLIRGVFKPKFGRSISPSRRALVPVNGIIWVALGHFPSKPLMPEIVGSPSVLAV